MMMAGRVDLPPLLPTPPGGFPTRCLALTPPPVMYASRVGLDSKNQQPGRATISKNWIKDKIDGRASRSSSWVADKVDGRALWSSGWVADKTLRCTTTSSGGVERLGRADRESGLKRPASRAPSADRCDKKARSPIKMEAASAAPLFAGPAPLIDQSEKMEAGLEASFFAGPTYIISPEPSELPMPSFIVCPKPGKLPTPTFLNKQD